MNVGALTPQRAHALMAGGGMSLAIPPITVRIRSPIASFAEQVHALYRDYALVGVVDFADVDIRMMPVRGVRRWARPQVQFVIDGVTPFDPFPVDHALPMFEWGLNWVFGQRMHRYLVLHAAVVERGGRAALLPAWPGSGKSTLSVSLACRGWRFLSDEFGVVTFPNARVLPFTRPVALKNESIGVMRAFDPNGFIGPVFPKTRKGDVAHFRVPIESVRRGSESAPVGVVVFPAFQSGASVSVQRLGKATAFLKLAGNAFNYEVVGERGFRAVTSIIRHCESYILQYGDLAEAHAAIDEIMSRGAPQ